MGELLRYTEQLKIEAMPYGQKVLKMFQHFPKIDAYFITLYMSSQYKKEGIHLTYCSSEIYFVEIDVTGLGRLRKIWEEIEDNFFAALFSFCTPEDFTPRIEAGPFNKEESDKICKRLLPFMISQGANKEDIPLIINDFPDFAKFALEYIP
jgi:hypothetical protein